MDLERVVTPGSVLVISHDIVGEQMAGPGIRYFHLARVLSETFDVALAVPHEVPLCLQDVSFRVLSYSRQDWSALEPLVSGFESVILPGDIADDFSQHVHSDAFLVVDGYDPLLEEWLALSQFRALEDPPSYWKRVMQHLTPQYLLGDFFICASERQRNWWLGLLEANGRINPWVFAEDRSLRRLIDVVPYGLPETAPLHTHQVIKEVWPGIKAQDRVILWGGGLWPWLDPLTAIRAMAEVAQQRPDVRLIFPGTRHPNPSVAEVPTHNEHALRLAQELDLLDRVVFFGGWIPYADWPNVLLESDLALTLHYDTLETQLAFRSRVLDYIWAGLPIVAAKGDATSDLIAHYGLGIVVDYEDVSGVAEAILKLLEVPMGNFEERFERARQALSWEQAAKPLIEFCRSPRRAPDRVALDGQVGNPFYVEERAYLVQERDAWRDLARRYEQGRFMRFMRWVQSARKRFGFR